MRHLTKKGEGGVCVFVRGVGGVGGGVITYYLRKTLIEGGKVISNNELFQQV